MAGAGGRRAVAGDGIRLSVPRAAGLLSRRDRGRLCRHVAAGQYRRATPLHLAPPHQPAELGAVRRVGHLGRNQPAVLRGGHPSHAARTGIPSGGRHGGGRRGHPRRATAQPPAIRPRCPDRASVPDPASTSSASPVPRDARGPGPHASSWPWLLHLCCMSAPWTSLRPTFSSPPRARCASGSTSSARSSRR